MLEKLKMACLYF